MRRVLWTLLGLVVLGAAVSSTAWALERSLAGVRLGEKALQLLHRPGFGQPNYIGPLGTVGLPSPQTGAAAAGQRQGPTGPAGGAAAAAMRGGARAGGMMGGGMRGGMRAGQGMGTRGGQGGMRGMGRAAASPAATTASAPLELAPTAMMGAGMRGGQAGGMRGGMGAGMRGGQAGGMRGGMGAGMRGGQAGGMRGGMGAGMRGGAAAGAARAAPAGRAGAGAGTGMYWYYRRPAGAVLVLGLSPLGEVTTITLSGNLPYAAGRTSRNIGLASSYMDVISRYGYPDETVTAGNAVQLTYVDHGVRYTLEGMRVTRIAIGADIVGPVEAAPTTTPVEAGPPPAGMSIEELKGYL